MKWKKIVIASILLLGFCVRSLEVYAESYIASSAPDEFYTNITTYYPDDQMANLYAGNTITPGRDAVLYNASFGDAGAGSLLRGYFWDGLPGYVYDSHTVVSYNENTHDTVAGDKIFTMDGTDYHECLNRLAGNGGSCKYEKISDSVDLGIVYIITNAENYLTKNGINPNTRTNGKLELSWFTQVAIWKYQNIDGFANISMTSNDIVEHIPPLGATAYENQKTQVRTTISSALTLWNLTSGLVTEAKSANSASSLTLNYDGNYSIEESKKKVKTTLISTSNSSSISSYSLDLSKAPSGTKVYNESGSEITSLTTIPSNTKFYLEIPVESLDNFAYDFNVTATATVSNYKGYKYKSLHGNWGSIKTESTAVLVTAEPQQINSMVEIKASHIEDSAISIPKITYIGGLFILLCGAGIVYFNIRPKKKES